VGLAMDRKQEKLLSLYWGTKPRRKKNLWNSLPPVYRQCAVCYTDFGSRVLVFFRRVIKSREDSGLTNHIERFNNSRQRISRLVRKTLSFSKQVENHIGAIYSIIITLAYQARFIITTYLPTTLQYYLGTYNLVRNKVVLNR